MMDAGDLPEICQIWLDLLRSPAETRDSQCLTDGQTGNDGE